MPAPRLLVLYGWVSHKGGLLCTPFSNKPPNPRHPSPAIAQKTRGVVRSFLGRTKSRCVKFLLQAQQGKSKSDELTQSREMKALLTV